MVVSIKYVLCFIACMVSGTVLKPNLPVKAEDESEPELHSHIVTSIVPPAGQDRTTHIEPP
jgi:hypothetical protein